VQEQSWCRRVSPAKLLEQSQRKKQKEEKECFPSIRLKIVVGSVWTKDRRFDAAPGLIQEELIDSEKKKKKKLFQSPQIRFVD
jgi:hypothetical protein